MVQIREGTRSSIFKGTYNRVDYSAYFELICTECRVVLGKQYQATPRLLDHLREVFSFDLSSISSYQLGSGEHNAATTVEEDNDTLPNGLPTMVELKEEINKVRRLI
jgi:hypothetical protein